MRKPWNRVDLPVYSVSSRTGDAYNMHICTYVSAVSMQPKQYMVALYHGTRTLELVEKNGHFLLQLLSVEQYNLVKLLGQQSGNKINKIQRLEKRKLLDQYNGFYFLKDTLAIMECRVIQTMEGGDHRLFLCDVISHRNLNPGEPLTTGLLRDKKIIRA